MIYSDLLHAIGNTPLVRVPFDTPATVYAKLEYLNPGGSVKDRAALFMIEEAERIGLLKPGGTIIEASSGNQGIAAAMIGAIKGYRVIITVSEKVSREKLDAIRAYGAEVILCPATAFIEDPCSYHAVAHRLHQETPNSFMINQYFNEKNREAHFRSLGPELWQQTQGKITHFYAATGTGGTISGAGAYLKQQNPAIHIYGVDAATSFRSTKGNPQPYCLEGIGVDFESPVIDYTVIDKMITVHDEQAITMLARMASHYGFLIGTSSGAVAWAVHEQVRHLQENDIVVMIFGDSGRAYLTRDFYATKPIRSLTAIMHEQDRSSAQL